MEYLKPEGAIEDMGVNYFPLQSEKGQTGYIRPNNFSRSKEKMITFLGGKGRNQVARSIRADKYLSPSFPDAPVRPKTVKSEEGTDPASQAAHAADAPRTRGGRARARGAAAADAALRARAAGRALEGGPHHARPGRAHVLGLPLLSQVPERHALRRRDGPAPVPRADGGRARGAAPLPRTASVVVAKGGEGRL